MTPIYRMLAYLNGEPSRKKKEKALFDSKDSTVLKNTMVYAMSPYKMFHIRAIPKGLGGLGTAEIDKFTWTLLDLLVKREVTGGAARDMLFKYIKTLNKWDADVVIRIIRKKLKCGVAAKTINVVWPGAIPERGLSLAETYTAGHVKLPSLVSVKIDGLRCEFIAGKFMTRGGGSITGLDHILDQIVDVGYPVHLDGELWLPDMTFDEMSGFLRRHDTVKTDARFFVFDNIGLKDKDQKFRYESLPYLMGDMFSTKMPMAYVPHYMIHSKDKIMQMFSQATKIGHEGIMVKDPGAKYSGLRNHDWMKLKRGIEREYMIDKLVESTEIPGTMGGYCITVKGRQITVGTGFTMQQREDWWKDKRKYQGAMATVQAMEETATSLRPPVVHKTIRWDL